MAVAYKVLGQVYLANTASYDVYTVPGGVASVVLSTINFCNLTGANATFSLAVRPGGATLANQHFLSYLTPLGPYDSIALTLGLTLANTDVLTVSSSIGNSVSVGVFGSEIT
jgi:hypothetical protein